MLDEVVVVGYGVQKKANLTGAVSTVDLNKTMAGRPQQDVAKALQGAVPGLSILTTSAVSYTHLDVYKRQAILTLRCRDTP